MHVNICEQKQRPTLVKHRVAEGLSSENATTN